MYSEFEDLLRSSGHVCALTGAGVSTLSGIPDFRGTRGVYCRPWRGRNVEELLSLECFREDPSLFYRWAEQFVYRCGQFRPSIVHQALARLERDGILASLYTQNIDRLHTAAGSRRVYELHGSAAWHHCLTCDARYPYAEIAPRVIAGKTPVCAQCGGSVKPDIVFYGETLDEKLLERAGEEFSETDLLLILGTKLAVYPVASLPEAVLNHGGKIVIVNAQPTRLDRYAAFHFDDLEAFGKALIKFSADSPRKPTA